MIKHLTVLTIALLLLNGCQTYELTCFENDQRDIKEEAVYNKIRAAFQDTLTNWVERELQPQRNFEDCIYKLDDALICDNNRTKCIFFILVNDTSSASKIHFFTKFIGCEGNANGTWNFYYRPYPTTYYSYLTEADNPFDYMSRETYMSLVQDGLMSNCSVNDEYLTGRTWFSDDREKEHKSFLRDVP